MLNKTCLLFLLSFVSHVAMAQEAKVGRASTVLVLPNFSPDKLHKETEYLDADGERVAIADSAHHRREIWYREAKAGSIKEFYPNGKLMDFALYASLPDRLRHGVHMLYYDNGQLRTSENYTAGVLEGERLMYYANGTLQRRDTFEKGKRITGAYFTADGKPAPYLEAYEMPVFEKGGLLEIVTAVQRAVHYPRDAQRDGIQGKVYASFVVTETGVVDNIKIVVGVSPSLNQATTDAVRTLHPFLTPGKEEGQPMKVNFTVPVTYLIQ